MTNKHIAKRFVALGFLLLMTNSMLLVVGGQQTHDNVLSETDKADIVEVVLQLESKVQGSEFESIKKLSSENIGFVQASRISAHGFSLVAASEIKELKEEHVVKYVVFRKIYVREGIVVVRLSRVVEGVECFGPVCGADLYI